MKQNLSWGTIALVPYWLSVHPKELENSDHFWWFYPISHYRTILYVGPFIESGLHITPTQYILTIKTSSLAWSIDGISSYLHDYYQISLSEISILWHVLEASSTCLISGHTELSCPLIAVIADTHHLPSPISSLLTYISSSGYTYLTCTHNQHAPFFSIACNIRSFSFPYTDLGIIADNLLPILRKNLIYYGNLISQHHVFRTEFVNKALTTSSLRLGGRLAFRKWLEELSQGNKYVFTCSLNGSFSFQTLMPLLYGNVVITDPICSANWIGGILPYLPECYVYHNVRECLDILHGIENERYSSASLHSRNISTSLIKPLISDEKSLQAAFSAAGFDPHSLPDVSTDNQKRLEELLAIVLRDFGLSEVYTMIRLYETLQESHRVNWETGIFPVTKTSEKSLVYDTFLRLIPTMLPRFKYPDPQGIHLQALVSVGTS